MLAYAPRPERRRLNPAALALIVGAHAVAIAAVMSARMDVIRHKDPPTIIELIRNPLPPEPPKDEPQSANAPPKSTYTLPKPLIEPLPLPGPAVDPLPLPDPGPLIGNGTDPLPQPRPLPIVRTGPRFATPDGDIRPPYPESMRVRDQEAVLKLRLSIDERGRVTAVDPIGKADPAFLAAARRHILKAWRYKPAMEGDRAIASSTVVTLEFQLD